MDDFINSITNFIDTADVNIGKLRVNTMKEIAASVIGETPVDSGMAKTNWQATKDAPATGVIPYSGPPDAAGAQAVSAAQATAFPDDGTWYFVNNLHYVIYLETGTSKMAAVGMARRNVKRISDNLTRKYG